MSIDDRVQAIVDGGEEADEILRASLAAARGRGRALERDRVRRGARDGRRPAARRRARRDAGARAHRADRLPRRHRRGLWFGSETPRRELDADLSRVAALLAPYCLVGWDTGGEEWVP